MHSITIVFGGGSIIVWTLMYKSKETAAAAHAEIIRPTDEDMLHITDDFGEQIHIKRSSIHGVMLEDMQMSKQAHIERALHQAHMQAETQQRAQADQKLRFHSSMQGPAMLSPMGMGNGRG